MDKRAWRVYYDQVTVRQHIITFVSLKTRASFGYGVLFFAPFHFEIPTDQSKLAWQGVNRKINDSIGYDIVERFCKKAQ